MIQWDALTLPLAPLGWALLYSGALLVAARLGVWLAQRKKSLGKTEDYL